LADQLLGEAAEWGRDLALAPGVLLTELGRGGLDGLSLDGVQTVLARGLVGDGDRLAHGRLGGGPDDPGDVLAVVLEQGELTRLDAGLAGELGLQMAGGGEGGGG